MALECGGGECAKFWVQQTGMGLGTVWSRPSTASQPQTLLKESSGMAVYSVESTDFFPGWHSG